MEPEQYTGLDTFAACPSTYRPPLFFTRYLRAFLPSYFADTAELIGQKCSADFVRLWGWESTRLMEREGISETVGDVMYYEAPTSRDQLNGATSRISEVYKSAFLRTLAWFRLAGLIDQDDYIEYSLSTCPIDPSVWEIESQKVPEWWPKASGMSSEIETFPEWEQCLALVAKEIEGGQLIAAEGAVIPSADRPLTASEFKLLPMGYSVKGPKFPEESEIFAALRHCIWLKYPQSIRPLVVFDGADMRGWIPIHDAKKAVEGLIIYPIVARGRSLNINHWKPWYGYHPPFFPSINLARMDGRLCQDGLSWFYETEGQKVFWGRDWKIGSLERTPKGQFMLHGQYAVIDKQWLQDRLDEEGLRLGHILRISLQHRKNEYEDPKIFHAFRSKGLSHLIL